MKLRDLLDKVQEKSLTPEQLDSYFDELCILDAKLHLEMSELEKLEALFIDGYEADTDIQKKRKWLVSEKGQRQIDVKNYIRALKPLIASIKSRIYKTIY